MRRINKILIGLILIAVGFLGIGYSAIQNITLDIKGTITAEAQRMLSSIAVTHPPTKTQYITGENFDPSGMIVTANYSDGSTTEVTGYTVFNSDKLAEDMTTVTIAYTEGDVTATTAYVGDAVLTQDPNTMFYMHGNSLTDQSGKGKSVSTSGGVSVSNNTSKYGGKSIYIPTTSYIYTNNAISGSGAFTVEMWYYPMPRDNNANNLHCLWSHGGTNASSRAGGALVWGGYSFGYYCNGWVFTTAANFSAYTWHHVALVGDGSSIKLYVNGVLQCTSSGVYNLNTAGERFGMNDSEMNFNGSSYGYMQDIKISNCARYTGTFTPQTQFDSNTMFYMHGNTLTDQSIKKKSVSTSGGVSVSNNTSKYGGKSIYIPTTSYIYTNNAISGSGAFTVEMWYYPMPRDGNANNTHCLWSHGGTNASSRTGGALVWGGNAFGYYCNGWVFTTGANFSTYTWHHVALVGDGSSIKLYVNGVLQCTSSGAYNLNTAGERFGMNDSEMNSNGSSYGYMQGIRISNCARYTGTFTPPKQFCTIFYK